jgi:hypothetical protein
MAIRKKTRRKSAPKPLGWNTTDQEEIRRRKERANSERFRVTSVNGDNAIFSTWQVTSPSGNTYQVEIRSLQQTINSCDCMDYQLNRLGTCKHIEATCNRLRRRKLVERAQGHPLIEIFLDRRDMAIKASIPERMRSTNRAKKAIEGFFDEAGTLRGDPLQSMAALNKHLSRETARIRNQIHLSSHLETWLQQQQQITDRRTRQRQFLKDLKSGRASLDLVKLPLFPYQQEGMMHLAFTGRALLADEMGLGKTVQAIAASELLDRLYSIEKVLVIAPASLKSEWLEQIHKFSDRHAIIIQGMRQRRHKLYQQPAFFYLANYEQILHDRAFINETLQPDLIILDEAQRIKNWQTKTAIAIKQLLSPHAFVLTGTPLENRIDEIYSITQFLDPQIFGPLFRFNRDFHTLDEKGMPTGYKNLDQLHERLRHIMLRRRKDDVEGELPPRSTNTYFVKLSDEQRMQYREHEEIVVRISAIASKRPLKKEERERLMIALGCMRMACDTTYILDQTSRRAPKLDELEKLLDELLSNPDCKIIVFSEWERMLTLLAERLLDAGIDYAWHTGSLSQPRRREEINRFRQSPKCRLFLATDSAATGLNLQIARVVVNLDLPWNPAKLEQRIARAWRKHQKHPVSVINLVSQDSIEHRMLEVLRHKTDLADEVIDGAGRTQAMPIGAGKGSLMEKVNELLDRPEPKKPPIEQFIDATVAQHPDNLAHLELRGDVLLAVVEEPDSTLAASMTENLTTHFGEATPQLEMLDRNTYETLQRLAEAGIIQFTQPVSGAARKPQGGDEKAQRKQRRRLAKAERYQETAREKRRMATLLSENGFINEALTPIGKAIDNALNSLATLTETEIQDPATLSEVANLQKAFQLPAELTTTLAVLRHEREKLDKTASTELLESAREILDKILQVTASWEAVRE